MLNLEGNKLGFKAVKDICDALVWNKSIEILNLSRNGISNVNCDDITTVFENNETLREFYM